MRTPKLRKLVTPRGTYWYRINKHHRFIGATGSVEIVGISGTRYHLTAEELLGITLEYPEDAEDYPPTYAVTPKNIREYIDREGI